MCTRAEVLQASSSAEMRSGSEALQPVQRA
jgi:hypothetical protein